MLRHPLCIVKHVCSPWTKAHCVLLVRRLISFSKVLEFEASTTNEERRKNKGKIEKRKKK